MDNKTGSSLPPVIGVPSYAPGGAPQSASPNNFGSGIPSTTGTPTIGAHPESEAGMASASANMPGGMGPTGARGMGGPSYAPQGGLPPVAVDPSGAPMLQQVQIAPDPPAPKKDYSGLIKNIIIVILGICVLVFVGLFLWQMAEKFALTQTMDAKVDSEVAAALDAQALEYEAQYQEREKYPYKTFSGPADYGELTFEYPKNWSMYVDKSAENGGDYQAYFNPDQVNAVSNTTVNALRLTISTRSYEDVVNSYRSYVESRNPTLSVDTRVVGNAKGTPPTQVNANYYTGTIPSTKFSGYIVIFKIRDKTVILQTDSKLFKPEFDKLLTTITFNA